MALFVVHGTETPDAAGMWNASGPVLLDPGQSSIREREEMPIQVVKASFFAVNAGAGIRYFHGQASADDIAGCAGACPPGAGPLQRALREQFYRAQIASRSSQADFAQVLQPGLCVMPAGRCSGMVMQSNAQA
jgi:hypothetical protein